MLSANKKILISIAVFILIVFTVIGLLLVFGGKNSDTGVQADVSQMQDYSDGVGSKDSEEEKESHTVPSTSPAMASNTASITDKQAEAVRAFMAGSYYISAVMLTDGEESQVDLAIRGSDLQTSMNLDGMRITVLYMSGKLYFVNEDKKTYVELSDLMLKTMGFDLSEMEDMTASMNLADYNFVGYEYSSEELNGNTADCFRYYTNSGESAYFYFIGDDLKQIEFCGADGVMVFSTTVSAFSATIPSTMLTLSGLTKSNLLSFFSEMVQAE